MILISEAASEAQKLQAELWSRVVQAAAAQSTPVAALAVSGMTARPLQRICIAVAMVS